ncbi:MAG: hypothetical protein R3E01_04215 [Pirellulaceae bacterium]
MKLTDYLEEFLVDTAAAFAEALARNVKASRPPTAATRAATTIGCQLAEAFAREFADAASEPTENASGGPPPAYSDEQIIAQRLAVWKHPVNQLPSQPLSSKETV